MILDSSAIVAIFFKEPGYEDLTQKIMDTANIGVSSATLVECGIVLSARLGKDCRGLLARFLQEGNVTTIYFTEAHYSIAVGAWIKYGKGRHPAALNFGDCLSYATAELSGLPLLCTGNDFAQTELSLA